MEILGADVFIGLGEEEQAKRHIGDVKAPTDKDVSLISICRENKL
jgi:hypothetical protein